MLRYFTKGNIYTHDDAEVLRVKQKPDLDAGNNKSQKYLVNRLHPYKSCSPNDESTRLPTTPWILPNVASTKSATLYWLPTSISHIPAYPLRHTLLLYASLFTSLPSTTIPLDLRLLIRDQGREDSRKHPN